MALLRFYLIVYNTLSALSWSYVFIITAAHVAGLTNLSKLASLTATPTAKSALVRLFGTVPIFQSLLPWSAQVESRLPPFLVTLLDRARTTFAAVGWQTALVQSCATIEVLHSLFAWVRSPFTTTLIQVASRLILVWGIADQYESARFSPFYASMVLSWSITEVIRYSFYAANRMGYEPKWLLWLRYNTFYVLYPTGAGSEAALIFATLPAQDAFTESDYGRGFLFLIWWPGLYFMYTYMIQQRKKIYGKGQHVGKRDKSKAA